MQNGLYVSLSAQVALERRLETIADNVANMNTVGYRATGVSFEKEMAKAASDIARVDAKLGNPDFLKRAPEDVVDGEREKREEAESRRAKFSEALRRLDGAA